MVPYSSLFSATVPQSQPSVGRSPNWGALAAIVVTADIPLASRCVKAGADVLAPTGKRFSTDSIGMALATRNLMDHLRETGQATSGPKGFGPRDRSNFLSALDNAVMRLKRAGATTDEAPGGSER